MRTFLDIGKELEADALSPSTMLALGEETLECWITANDQVPTDKEKEGFRLIALHRQGAKGDPSFNACRETCRELIYHYNLITLDPEHDQTLQRLNMMKLVASHLYYFIAGKIEKSDFGEFCCSSRSVRAKLDS
jgi:hypothetical protein